LVPASIDISISKVVWRVYSAPAFGRGSNGCVGELASCVVSADELVVVGFAFTRDVCARVRQSTYRACIGGRYFIYVRQLAIV